jgi:hypothetical protein
MKTVELLAGWAFLLYLSPPRRFPNGLFGSDKKSKGKKSNKNVQVKNDK